MRSEMIFRAQVQVANRYELCRKVAKVTRRLHFASGDTQDAIRDAFVRLAEESRISEIAMVYGALPYVWRDHCHEQVEEVVCFSR